MKKKFFAIFLCIVMAMTMTLMAACSKEEPAEETAAEETEFLSEDDLDAIVNWLFGG